MGWLRAWLVQWRNERIVLRSNLPADILIGNLARDVETPWSLRTVLAPPPTPRAVVGRVSRTRVRVSATPRWQRNSWRPMLRARVISDGDRSRLEGRLGWHPFVRVFSAVWLGFVCAFSMFGAVGAAVHLAEGRFRDALPFLLFAGVAGLLAGIFVAMIIFAGRSARPDVDYLRSWLTRHTEPLNDCN